MNEDELVIWNFNLIMFVCVINFHHWINCIDKEGDYVEK